MKPFMCNQRAFTVVGIVDQFSYHDEAQKTKIGEMWREFFAQHIADTINHQEAPQLTYALYHDYKPSGEYALLLGKEVAQKDGVVHPLIDRHIPQGRYVLLELEGHPAQALGDAWKFVWSPEFAYTRAFSYDYEVYHDSTRQDDGTMKIELYIAIV